MDKNSSPVASLKLALRLPSPVIIAVCMSVVVAGCIGDQPATSISQSHAQAVANAVTTMHEDLPTYNDVPRPMTQQARRELELELKCGSPGHPPQVPRFFAYAQSDLYVAGERNSVIGAGSSIFIMPTARQVRQEIARSDSRAQNICALRKIQRQVGKQFHVARVTLRPLTVNVEGAEGTFAQRAIIRLGGSPSVIYSDTVSFAYGQDLIGMGVYRYGRPASRRLEEDLVGLLMARAREHNQ